MGSYKRIAKFPCNYSLLTGRWYWYCSWLVTSSTRLWRHGSSSRCQRQTGSSRLSRIAAQWVCSSSLLFVDPGIKTSAVKAVVFKARNNLIQSIQSKVDLTVSYRSARVRTNRFVSLTIVMMLSGEEGLIYAFLVLIHESVLTCIHVGYKTGEINVLVHKHI